MIGQIDKYWDKLFADPIPVETPDGPIVIQPQRTNNVLERFFRDLKRDHRRRTGSNSYKRALKSMPTNAPLVKKLQNHYYPKFGRCSEWDTAAGVCILEGAGGKVVDFQNQPLRYNTREDNLSSTFVASA